ncbi:MAG TPA: DHHA1 domain-containing protein, partial [Candidatus Limnocylindria bacterium]
ASPGVAPLVLRDDRWAPGLVGLVAGRLADALARPVAAATTVGAEIRGSVRAPADFHVASALEACQVHLTKRGGHAAAGGFSLLPEAWEAFVGAFGALPRPYPTDAARERAAPGRQVVDLVLPARYLDWELADQLDRLAPYGPGHLEPMLAVTGMTVTDVRRVGATEAHLAFRMRRGLETIDAIAFGHDPERPLPGPGVELDLVGTLERDTFGGMPRLRLRVVDFAASAHSPLIARRVPPRELARAG